MGLNSIEKRRGHTTVVNGSLLMTVISKDMAAKFSIHFNDLC